MHAEIEVDTLYIIKGVEHLYDATFLFLSLKQSHIYT